MSDELRAEIEAEAAKALRERFGRLGILSRAVVHNHPTAEEIAAVVLDVADRVHAARGSDDAKLKQEVDEALADMDEILRPPAGEQNADGG